MNHLQSVKNLIFDLGGVIIDLSIDKTVASFASLSGINHETAYGLYNASPGFEKYEKGLIDDEAFRTYVREIFGIQSSDTDIDKCWNAMLLGLPSTKLQLLLRLKEHYRVFLLSNTNAIHIDYINSVMLPGIEVQTPLDYFFHRAYYSHIMKKRKPEAAIYQQVLEENQLLPNETLFLDDNIQNLEGANILGIQTAHVQTSNFILDYFNEQ